MRIVYILFIVVLCIRCAGPEPRRPVQTKSGSYYKASIERSKRLLAKEEKKIQQIIAADSLKHYNHTAAGAWYHYWAVNDSTDYTPKTDDLVAMSYDVLSFDNDTLYSAEDIGPISYRVDKQELFIGLRDAVKILKEGEKATFLFPSSVAYGYQGDTDKIGTNVPLKVTLTIESIEKQNLNTEN